MYAILPHTLDVVPVTVVDTFSAILGSGVCSVSQKRVHWRSQQRPRLFPGTGVPRGPGLEHSRFPGADFGPCGGQVGGSFRGLRARLEQPDSATPRATQAAMRGLQVSHSTSFSSSAAASLLDLFQ